MQFFLHVTSDDKNGQGSLGGSRVNCKAQSLLPRQSEIIAWLLKIHLLEPDRGSVLLYLVYGDQIQSIDPQPKHRNTWTQGIWDMGNDEVFFQIIHIKKDARPIVKCQRTLNFRFSVV